MTADLEYSKLGKEGSGASFIISDDAKCRSPMTGEKRKVPQSISPTALTLGSQNSSENLIASKTTKASSFSYGANSPIQKPDKGQPIDLAVIEEELQVEEGCENEFELNRATMQKIRNSSRLSQWSDNTGSFYRTTELTLS